MDSQTLWTKNLPVAKACLTHPFVTGVADGTLPRKTFEHYVGQDAFFLDSFVKAYALGIAKSSTAETMATFKTLLDGAFDELALHGHYAKQWGVNLQLQPTPATRAYTDFLLHVAALEPLANLCAAMTPCMRLYAWLGQQLQPIAASKSPYIEWIQTYSSPQFDELATTMEHLLDDLGDSNPPADADHDISERYGTAMTLELAFFDSVHTPPAAGIHR